MKDFKIPSGVVTRPIAGYEKNYRITSDGRIFARRRRGSAGGELQLFKDNNGYFIITLCKSCQKKTRKVHQLVLLAYRGPCPDGLVTRHLDGNCTNNKIENLKYGTQSENLNDRYGHGTMIQGEKIYCSKLTAKQVLEIRKKWDQGDIQQKTLAKDYNVVPSTISAIVTRKNWKHI